ncbi:glycosyltransferase [Roseibium album]|uniref:GDP-mannose-dependent alpha-(1-6)-phosphatidylinositol monomannoside mannosyltransferase n=1 Tax=Roseibium album TaxID=311410 RepID=A0A0M6ZL44_9HYPH|nr:glycosyltransferase [Roseibium album]CTQ63488.1 GDP-mannose-dependent alpha-(1-6)-phosphatidylinositol monomannoside mannosyltransferase [Roseibium album]CTQ79545.1 GDP-mannose-dependent alpha-(1-6)-phosphatidylinositol monomannoside mannosyltransferase [Roseibium album]CTQ81075.1 GDP-mannose-dependent alpha-(1-6)-phosphatidylinositol monomannoside mannosyltransferase [Roseibium album]
MATDVAQRSTKLAHIHLGVDGGAEKFFVRLSRALAKRGVEQIAFIRHDRPWRDELAEHCTVRELKFSRSHLKRHFVRWGIAREIKNFGAKATLGWMSPASKWLPKPGPDMRTFLRLGDFPDGFHTYGNVEHLIGNTPEIVRQAVEAGWPADRAHMISNFVDPLPDSLQPVCRAEFDTPKDATVLIALGRFVERKRFDLIIKALAQLPETIHAWLIGDGDLLEEMQRLARDLGVENRTHFLGWHRDPSPFLLAADILVCPSDDEPLGNVVLEGWNAGLPVVATASQGPSWLIEHGKTGLLSECGDVDGLVGSIKMIVSDRTQMSRLGTSSGGNASRVGRDEICAEYSALLYSA